MHISDSICSDCKNFDHECSFSGNSGCYETCSSKDDGVRDKFYDFEPILECKEFKVG